MWNLLCILKLPQVIHERLRASNCERGNYDGAAAFGDSIHTVRQHGGGITSFMLAIAVCGFTQQYVSPRRRGGIIQYRFAVATNVSRKDDYRLSSILRDRKCQACRAKYVAGVVRIKMKFGRNVETARSRHRL